MIVRSQHLPASGPRSTAIAGRSQNRSPALILAPDKERERGCAHHRMKGKRCRPLPDDLRRIGSRVRPDIRVAIDAFEVLFAVTLFFCLTAAVIDWHSNRCRI